MLPVTIINIYIYKRDSGGIVIYIKDTYVNDKNLIFKSEDDMIMTGW